MPKLGDQLSIPMINSNEFAIIQVDSGVMKLTHTHTHSHSYVQLIMHYLLEMLHFPCDGNR